MISVADAETLITESLSSTIEGLSGPTTTCDIAVDNARGYTLAADVTAPFDLPSFDNSAMDGFAVVAADLTQASAANPVALNLTGTSSAGNTDAVPALVHGQCCRVMTGAPLPPGADAVVMVEHTSGFIKSPVTFFHPAHTGQNIRRQAEELRAGDVVLKKGTTVAAFQQGLLATLGHATASVFRQPRIALICTGDELINPGQHKEVGQIYNSNHATIAGLIAQCGAVLVNSATAGDTPDQLHHALSALTQPYDLIVTTGGVSMGQHDCVRQVAAQLDFSTVFWRVAQKPGMPLFVARRAKQLWVGLPGNPVSAAICFVQYVWPALDRLQGKTPPPWIIATLTDSFPREATKHRFLFGRAWTKNASVWASPTQKLGSHMLSAACEANCLLSSEPGSAPLTAGSQIYLKMLPNYSLQEVAP